MITWILLQRTQRCSVSVSENDQYLCIDAIVEKFLTWKYWRDNVLNYSRLTQMTKNVLSCSIFFINIEWTFDLARRICQWDWSQMTSESVEQIMLLKYYNRIMNLNSEKTIIEAWNIYCKEEDEDNVIDESDNSFKTVSWDCLHHSHEIVSKRKEIEIWVNDKRVEKRFSSVHINIITTCR